MIRSLIGAVTLSVVALAPVAASAADGWVLWEHETLSQPPRRTDRYVVRLEGYPLKRTVAVYADKAACLAVAHALITMRHERPWTSPISRGGAAMTAGDIMALKNGQGFAVILKTTDGPTTLVVAECWPVGVNPQ